MKVGRRVQPLVENVCVDSSALEYRFPMFLESCGDSGRCGCELVVVGENRADGVGGTWYSSCKLGDQLLSTVGPRALLVVVVVEVDELVRQLLVGQVLGVVA